MTRFSRPGARACWLILSSILLFSLRADAYSPRIREMVAVIQSVNHENRTLTVNDAQGHPQRTFVWNANTTFVRDGKAVQPVELQTGTRATISYRRPFFGKWIALKIAWKGAVDPVAASRGEPVR